MFKWKFKSVRLNNSKRRKSSILSTTFSIRYREIAPKYMLQHDATVTSYNQYYSDDCFNQAHLTRKIGQFRSNFNVWINKRIITD